MRISTTHVCIAMFVLLSQVACAEPFESSGSLSVTLGTHDFEIPARYSMESSISNSLTALPGADDSSRDVLLKIPAAEISREIPGYDLGDDWLAEDIVFRLVALTPSEVDRYEDSSRYADLWFGRGTYHDRLVESYDDVRWFKVYRKMEYPYSWAVLRRFPRIDEELPRSSREFWVAHCLRKGAPRTSRGFHVSCQSFVLLGDLGIDFRLGEQNLPLIEQVTAFLLQRVEGWSR